MSGEIHSKQQLGNWLLILSDVNMTLYKSQGQTTGARGSVNVPSRACIQPWTALAALTNSQKVIDAQVRYIGQKSVIYTEVNSNWEALHEDVHADKALKKEHCWRHQSCTKCTLTVLGTKQLTYQMQVATMGKFYYMQPRAFWLNWTPSYFCHEVRWL